MVLKLILQQTEEGLEGKQPIKKETICSFLIPDCDFEKVAGKIKDLLRQRRMIADLLEAGLIGD